MKSLKLSILALMILQSIMLSAQTKGTVIDQKTGKPVSNVSIYAKSDSKVLNTASNERGEFEVDFPFTSLFFSHIGYEKVEIKKSELSSTVALFPTSFMLDEVVVNGSQPAWITKKLREVVKQKPLHYQTHETAMVYDFKTMTVDKEKGYSFKSSGALLVPNYTDNKEYMISPKTNIIYYKDTTAGMDFAQLRRMIYDSFQQDFTNSFVNHYRFAQDYDYKSNDTNTILLQFKSNKYHDYGYIIVDTAKNVILEYERNSGRDVNYKKGFSFLMKTTYTVLGAYRTIWDTYSHGKYELIKGSYQLVDYKYQEHTQDKGTKGKYKGMVDNHHAEASLVLKEDNNLNDVKWIILPRPNLIVLSKKKRKKWNDMYNFLKTYEKF